LIMLIVVAPLVAGPVPAEDMVARMRVTAKRLPALSPSTRPAAHNQG
jgi:hypothetical protein